jgi:hypothetical protein
MTNTETLVKKPDKVYQSTLIGNTEKDALRSLVMAGTRYHIIKVRKYADYVLLDIYYW